jgi:uncharacterized protein YjbI with pentapeptide repeats
MSGGSWVMLSVGGGSRGVSETTTFVERSLAYFCLTSCSTSYCRDRRPENLAELGKAILGLVELLIIPVVLGLGGIWFNSQARKSEQELAQRERENDRQIAEDRVQEEALQRYLDRMQELILDKGLKRSKKFAEIRSVARARTLAVLRSLDGDRKGQVVRFLHESDLIGNLVQEPGEGQVIETIINLQYADLSGANLVDADLSDTDLVEINLRDANLFRAYLTNAVLLDANLSGANVRDADLSDTDLYRANLSFADLTDAFLYEADLRNSDLYYANLSGTSLSSANLGGANLFGAYLRGVKGWTNEQLAQAWSLVSATMPDGTKMTEEAWEEFKTRYRK